jgi:hypothetical protein
MGEGKPKFGDRWLTIKEAAEYTRTDEDWILDHIRSGALKCVATARRKSAGPKGPKRRVVDRLKLDAIMEALENYDKEAPQTAEAAPTPSPPAARPKLPRDMSSREMYKRGL